MPRDGYESVTLPEKVVERIDGLRDGTDMSRGETIETALVSWDASEQAREEVVDERLERVEDRLDHLPELIGDEIERRMGR
jgi:metal-responsive CopG/Arc/MetJ family transcriptional regulator